MLDRYRSALAESRALNRQLRAPLIHIPILATVVVVLIVIALGVIYGSERHASSEFQEGGSVTVVSAVFMALAAALALTAFYLSRKNPRRSAWFWLLCGLAFGFFAADELLQFHEYVGYLLGGENRESPMMFRNWNDVVVILYGLAAVVVCAYFLPEILMLPRFGVLIAVAGMFYVLHTGIDSVFERSDRSVFVEESCKLFSVAFFALAFLAGVQGMSAMNAHARSEPAEGSD